MRRRSFAIGFAAGSFIATRPAPLRAQGTTPLRVATGISDTYAEPIYAQAAGFFTRAGLDVTVAPQTNPSMMLTGVIAGAFDIGITNTTAIATAVLHGIPLVIVGTGALYRSEAATTVLVVARDAALRTAKDLEGKTVATSGLQDMNTVGVKAWVAQGGADVEKVRFVELGFPQMGPAVARGAVDAATLNEPFVTAERAQVRTLAKFFDAIGRRFANGIFISTPGFVRANPALVRRFMDAIYASAKWANTHHDDTAAILTKTSRVGVETIRSMTRVYYAESFDPRLVQPSLDAASRFKALDRHVDVAELLWTP